MKRRQFMLVCTGAAAALGGLLLMVPDEDDPRKILVFRLADTFPDPAAVRKVGAYVLDSLPATSTEVLLDDLFSTAEWSLAGKDEFTTLQERIRLDFSNNNTITVNAWTLSRTEALCYALIAKLTGGPGSVLRSLVGR